MDTLELPSAIYVSGNKFFLRGFNGWYYLVTNPRNGCREYRKHERFLRIGLYPACRDIPIEPAKILRGIMGSWILATENENDPNDYGEVIHGFRYSGGRSPVGEWDTILVTSEESSTTWWRSNSDLVLTSLGILCNVFVGASYLYLSM